MKLFLSLYAIPLAIIGSVAIINSTYFSLNPLLIPKTNVIVRDSVKVVLEKTNFKNLTVLYITATAQTTAGISEVLGKAYGELMQYTREKNLQPLKFLAWYYSIQPPWQMDVAIETDSISTELSGRIKLRIQEGGEVLILHMWGPCDKAGQAYLIMENWLKENKRKPKGKPFEVYINDPSAVKSSSEIQTDIYQPIE